MGFPDAARSEQEERIVLRRRLGDDGIGRVRGELIRRTNFVRIAEELQARSAWRRLARQRAFDQIFRLFDFFRIAEYPVAPERRIDVRRRFLQRAQMFDRRAERATSGAFGSASARSSTAVRYPSPFQY